MTWHWQLERQLNDNTMKYALPSVALQSLWVQSEEQSYQELHKKNSPEMRAFWPETTNQWQASDWQPSDMALACHDDPIQLLVWSELHVVNDTPWLERPVKNQNQTIQYIHHNSSIFNLINISMPTGHETRSMECQEHSHHQAVSRLSSVQSQYL